MNSIHLSAIQLFVYVHHKFHSSITFECVNMNVRQFDGENLPRHIPPEWNEMFLGTYYFLSAAMGNSGKHEIRMTII